MEVNFLVAFMSGLMSFFAPCVVPLLPAYVGYVSGISVKELMDKDGARKYRKKLVLSSLFYVLGFSIVFVLMGTTVALLGLRLGQHRRFMQMVGGILVMFFGLSMMDVVKIPVMEKERKVKLPGWTERLGYGKAMVVGMVFASAWTPCVGPVLGAILTLSASSRTVVSGSMLLFVYSLGISLPFLIVSSSLAGISGKLKKMGSVLEKMNKFFGVVMVVLGFLLFNNYLKFRSNWLTYDGLNGFLFGILR